jgi:hypothetical protein
MIHCLLPVFILSADTGSADASVPTASQFPQAVEMRHWDFEQGDDKNYDRWPDAWTRRKGRGYPLYLKVEIADDVNPRPESQRSLHLELDGGAALVFSEPIKISPLFSYVLSGYLKTRGLQHDVAYASLLFYDEDRKNLLETHESKRYQQVGSWTRFQIGPVIPASGQVREAVIALHLKPTDRVDLTGAAMFDDLWFGNLPRVSLETNSDHNVYEDRRDVQVTCNVSGISHPNPLVRFELFDVDGNQLVKHQQTMTGDTMRPRPGRVFSGSATWNPPIRTAGFYEIRVSMSDQASDPISTTIAILGDIEGSESGEFGWTLPNGDDPLSLKTLVGLLSEMGIHWVKFPVWYSDTDKDRADQLAWFAERMSTNKIQLIGVLDQPPEDIRELFGNKNRLPVASIFVEPELWHPAVDPVMTRLSLKVRWWQLGADNDTSFVNFPDLEKSLGEIREGFNRFGQQINLGIAWRSIDETPVAASPPWSFLSYVANPPLTALELTRYLSEPRTSTAKRWLVLEPIAQADYSLETRARDLVARMLTAKMEKADGVFVPDPFDPEHGLMNADGTPGKMLLPWRTTAKMISGAKYVGSIELPSGSPNHIFVRGDEAVMVVWNETPTQEVIYLGEDVDQIDVWGRRTRPRLVKHNGFVRQEIQVDRLPTFVTNVDPAIARWRMAFRFDTDKIASVFGQEQHVTYTLANSFDQGVGGRIKLHTPEVWKAAPKDVHFKLSANELHQRRLDITLEPNASSGNQPVRVDFEITAVRGYRFSVYRSLQVGLGDIVVDVTSRLDADGNLLIEQQLINNTDRFLSFNCLLSTSERRRERRQIFNRGRGTTTIVFAFPNGEELLGKTMWLRVEEIDGSRILNHQIIAHE